METGLSQGLVSRSVENSVCLGPISRVPDKGQEGFALHHGKGDELSMVAAQEDSYNLKNRYDDNLYAQSTYLFEHIRSQDRNKNYEGNKPAI